MKIGWITALGILIGAPLAHGEHTIELVTGEVLRGEIIEQDDTHLVLEHGIFGRMDIPASAVWRVIDLDESGEAAAPTAEETPPVEKTVITSPEVVPEAPPVAAVPIAEPVPDPWDAQLELGLNAREGTTQDSNVRAAFRASRITPGSIFRYDATYRLATNRGDRTENNLTTGGFFEWPHRDTPLSYFAQGRFDMAEFQSYDQRYTGSGGVGYRLIDINRTDNAGTPTILHLTARAGAGVRREVGSENDELAPEGLLGGEFQYQLNETHTVALSSLWHPDLSDTDEFRLVSAGSWTISLHELDGISLRLGFTHEYQSRTDDDVSHFDLAAFAALLIDF